jgi:hypothetical protein
MGLRQRRKTLISFTFRALLPLIHFSRLTPLYPPPSHLNRLYPALPTFPRFTPLMPHLSLYPLSSQFLNSFNLLVATPFWPSVRMKLTLPKLGIWSPPGLPNV